MGQINTDRNYIIMTDANMVDVPFEGANPFESESENETSEASPAEENETDEAQSPDGEQGANDQDDPDKDKPFHEHPRWKTRETEWDTRFNDQESRHQDDLKKIREEFTDTRKGNAEETQIPLWFGGDQEAWNAYRTDRDAEIKSAEDRAFERANSANKAEDEAVKEATTYMETEIATIQSDKKLNPSGATIDPNKLLKIVMDNDLVDSQGKWNYKAGYAIMRSSDTSGPDNKTRKKVAGATTSEGNAEDTPANFKTSDDFKVKKPW